MRALGSIRLQRNWKLQEKFREEIAAYSTAEIEAFVRADIERDFKQNLYEMAEGPCDEGNPFAVANRDWARAEYLKRYPR